MAEVKEMLTKIEAYAVADLINLTLFETIRNNPEIDNMRWLINLVHAYEKLCEQSGYAGATEGREDDTE